MIQKKNDEESNNNFKIRWDCKERAQHNNEDYPYSEETNLLQQKAVEIHETGGVGDFVKFYNETESKGFVFEVPFEIRKVRKEEMHSAYNIYKGCFMAWNENMKKWVKDNPSIGLYEWGEIDWSTHIQKIQIPRHYLHPSFITWSGNEFTEEWIWRQAFELLYEILARYCNPIRFGS